jgi:pimeloyl-ACP methyl ester carboxylesterase
MANFVMIHGAWHGSWCWNAVTPLLRAAGHAVFTPTLTGLAERRHLLSAQVSLHTHISDVANLIELEDLRDVVLVAHSYGGVVGASVAGRCLDRIKHLVWVDAHVPHSGESWADLVGADAARERIKAANEQGLGMAIPAPDIAAWGLNAAQLADAKKRLTPHPLGCFTRGAKFDEVKVYALPKTYISCDNPRLDTVNVSRNRAQSWHVCSLQTGHDPMITAPQELVNIMLREALGAGG